MCFLRRNIALFLIPARNMLFRLCITAGIAPGIIYAQTAVPLPENNETFVPHMLIVKVNKENSERWNHFLCEKLIAGEYSVPLGKISVSKVFPRHLPCNVKNTGPNGRCVDLSTIYFITYQNDFPPEALAFRLTSTNIFDYAEPLPAVEPLFIPNDEKISSQYYLGRINAYQAWDICRGDTNMIVGIVDSGTDLDHPDLEGKVFYNYNDPVDGVDNDNDGFIDNYQGWDMGDMDNLPQVIPGGSNASHGVHMCGIASAATNNGTGVAGVGFNSRFLPVKMNDINDKYIAGYQGIVYAADHGCKVINCSWGSQHNAGQFGQDIINYATFNKDALVVAASGNSNNTIPFYPASYENVLSVAATGVNDERMFVSSTYASSYGYYVDVCAPGSAIFNTWDFPNFYKTLSGTSMAAAVTSGAAAIIRTHFPGYTALQTAEKLRSSADRIDTLPVNTDFFELLGTGRINLFKALTDTSTPSIRILNPQFSNGNNNTFRPGDTISLTGEFYNYLADAFNITIKAACHTPGIQMTDSLFAAPAIPSASSVNNLSMPFRFILPLNMPGDTFLMIKIVYTGNGFHSFEYLRLDLNCDYLDITAQDIKTTLTSKGKIGFNDPWKMQGHGFCYRNDRTLLVNGGVITGTNYYQVSDVLYNSTFSGFDADFITRDRIFAEPVSSFADHEYITTYDDAGAGINALGASITQKTFTWDAPEDCRYVIHEYTLHNESTASLPNLYLGLFVDWDVNDQAQDYDRITWDNDCKMGITSSITGGPLAGISLLSEGPFRHYAFDNNGSNGSINITDGFSSQEKYTALKSVRPQAGMAATGNNVSDLVGSGPFLVQAGDSVTVAFALLAADHLSDLKEASQRARLRYNHLNAVNDLIEKSALSVEVFPNPATSMVNIRLFSSSPANFEISVFNPFGMMMLRTMKKITPQAWSPIDIDLDGFPPGTYFLMLNSNDERRQVKLIKL